jgi:hypothetical protein
VLNVSASLSLSERIESDAVSASLSLPARWKTSIVPSSPSMSTRPRLTRSNCVPGGNTPSNSGVLSPVDRTNTVPVSA